jgi:hypothetical protein
MVISQHKFFIKQGPWHILTTTKGAGKNIILQFPHLILWSGKNKIKSISSQESTRGLLGRKIHTSNGIVEANELNVPAITARTAVSNKDSVERQLLAAKPNKPNPHWPFYSSHRSNKNILLRIRPSGLLRNLQVDALRRGCLHRQSLYPSLKNVRDSLVLSPHTTNPKRPHRHAKASKHNASAAGCSNCS